MKGLRMLLYTPEELASETRPLSEMALDALAQGDLDQVRFLLGRMSVGHFELYFGYLDWVTRLAGKVLRDFGEDYFEAASRSIAQFLMAPYADRLQKGAEKGSIEDIMTLWCHQLGRIDPLGETKSEVAFSLAPCGSGGRLVLGALYEAAPQKYPRLKDGKPLFCRICEHLQEALNEASGKTFWSAVPDQERTGFCQVRFSKDAARGKWLFSTEETFRLLTPGCSQALQRIAHGRQDIQELLRDQHTEWRPLHDLLNLWVTSLFSMIYEDKGIPYLSELLWETYVKMFDSTYRMYSAMDTRSLFRNLVRLWYYHQATFRVTEEEDRFVFCLDPCGSGGRLYRGEVLIPGVFRYGTGMLCEIREANDITFQRAPFPIYCIHCAGTNRDQFQGKPWPFLVDGEAMNDPSAPCIQYLYKKEAPLLAPPQLLRQVGLQEAKPLAKEYVL
jgi:hypothetical protein